MKILLSTHRHLGDTVALTAAYASCMCDINPKEVASCLV